MNGNNYFLDNPELKKNPFKVPDSYFETTLEQELSSRIKCEEFHSGRREKKSIWKLLKPQMELAACFLIIFGLGYSIMHLISSKQEYNSNNEIPSQFITPSLIQAIYSNQDLDKEDCDESIDAIVDYLQEQGVSFATIASAENF